MNAVKMKEFCPARAPQALPVRAGSFTIGKR